MANVNQVYTIVNSIAGQALGTAALAVTDTSSLVSLGNDVLSSSSDTDAFMSTLVQRISHTVFSNRAYTSPFTIPLYRDSNQWGQVTQKISMKMSDAESDDSVSLTNGASVDMYKVSKPEAIQKLFKKTSTYQWHKTIQRQWLKSAFTSENEMARFISMITTTMNNQRNLAMENLSRLTIANYIAELTKESDTPRVISLLTEYKAASGDSTITAATAAMDQKFLQYVSSRIDEISTKMQGYSTLYNDGTIERFTPKEAQSLFMSSTFMSRMRNIGYANTFNAQFNELNGFTEVPYWQAAQTPDSINIKPVSGGEGVTLGNIVGFLCDFDAAGYHRSDVRNYTTPFNAAGEYTNLYMKADHNWFNDLSENGVVFVIA